MAAHELAISGPDEPLVALAMTGASFDAAQQAGIRRVEANTDAMQYIARNIGVIAHDATLPPLVIVTRDNSDTRRTLGQLDDRLPTDQSSPKFSRYFPANALEQEHPPTGNREELVSYAKAIGAQALTEVSVASWDKDESHIVDFAKGLLLGERPLGLGPPPALGIIGRGLSAVFGNDARALSKISELRKALRDSKSSFPEPFQIFREPTQPQLQQR